MIDSVSETTGVPPRSTAAGAGISVWLGGNKLALASPHHTSAHANSSMAPALRGDPPNRVLSFMRYSSCIFAADKIPAARFLANSFSEITPTERFRILSINQTTSLVAIFFDRYERLFTSMPIIPNNISTMLAGSGVANIGANTAYEGVIPLEPSCKNAKVGE
jgi:hypothetical protein